jgi:hypothetical protein
MANAARKRHKHLYACAMAADIRRLCTWAWSGCSTSACVARMYMYANQNIRRGALQGAAEAATATCSAHLLDACMHACLRDHACYQSPGHVHRPMTYSPTALPTNMEHHANTPRRNEQRLMIKYEQVLSEPHHAMPPYRMHTLLSPRLSTQLLRCSCGCRDSRT